MSPSLVPKPSASRRLPALRSIAIVVLLAGAGLGLGYLLGQSATKLPWLREKFGSLAAIDLLALPLLVLLTLAVHELGHLLAGMSRGMRFLLLIVGPLQWTRSPGGVRFKWHGNLGLMGGLAAATPDPDQPLRPQLQRLVAGGPLASLVLAIVALGASALLGDRPGAYAVILGFLSLAIFAATAIPLHVGGFMSDGMQLLELRRGGAAVAERQLLLRLMGLSLAEVRPRDWDRALVREALSLDHAVPMRRVAGRVFGLYHAMDCDDREQLLAHAAWLAEHLDDYPQGFRQAITLELCLIAAQSGDLEAARRWWQRSPGGVVDAARRALAEASLAALEGDQARASRAVAAAARALPRAMDPGVNQLTADQLDVLGRRAGVESVTRAEA